MTDDASSDVTAPDASWLAKLPNHSIFLPPQTPPTSSSPAGVTAAAAAQHDAQDDTTPNCMAVRNADVLLSYGKELRMTSLLEVKHQHSDAYRSSTTTSSPSSLASYKRLTARVLDFDIERLLVNPTGKLLAVVGAHKVVIVVLPRTGAFLHSGSKKSTSLASSESVDVGVKAALVGTYYHHERIGGKARLADVQWHPWGELGSSLLTMTRDGILREFDVSLDVEEPVQTLSLLSGRTSAVNYGSSQRPRYRSHSARRDRSRSRTPAATNSASRARARRSASRIAFEDESASDDGQEEAYFSGEELDDGGDESFYTAAAGSIRSLGGVSQGRTAVAFTLGIDMRSQGENDDSPSVPSDWTPLTVFTLCTNGDLYSLCPFIPKRASLPLSYLRSLASHVSLTRPDSIYDSGDAGDLQVRFVSSLLKQASAQRQGLREDINKAARRRAMSATPMSIDPSSRAGSMEPGDKTANLDEDDDDDEQLVTVQAPSAAIVPAQPQTQGPYLLAPAPHELSDERESRGADVFFARVTHADEGLNVIGIASDDGRVDLCVVLTPVSAAWGTEPLKKKRSSAPAKAGRYALSDSDDDSHDDDKANTSAHDDGSAQLPMLIVYESIDLGILHAVGDHIDAIEHALRTTPVRFIVDPLYADLVYVRHLAGAHAIGFGPWARRLIDAMQNRSGDGHISALERALHQGTPSDVACVVNSVPQDNQGFKPSVRLNPIRDVCIVSDVYLCYSFMALAQSGTLVALGLNLRVDEVQQQQEQSHIGKSQQHSLARPSNDERWLQEATGSQVPPAYASLLGDGPPFVPPEPFKSFQGLPAQPRSAVLRPGGGRGELIVSPDTLRTLGTTVQTLRGQIRDVVQGGNTVQKRLELQVEELKRQLGKLDQVAKRVKARQDESSTDSLTARLKRVVDTQQSIVRRSDRLLQRLIESHSPELSVYEKHWLEELHRLQTELGGVGETGTTTTGLTARVEALRHRLNLLKPDLEKAATAQDRASAITDENPTPTGLLGRQQLLQIEKMLDAEGRLLTLDQEKIHQLNVQVQRQIRAGSTNGVVRPFIDV